MFKRPLLVFALFAGLSAGANAACPTSVPGDTADAIRANAERVQCLQQEVEQDARRRQYELELRATQNALNDLRLQRRFDNLPRYTPPPAFGHQPFVGQ
jgi:hypothetical protein